MVPYSVPEDVSFVSNSRLMEILGI
jgi:hypothetical protein